MLIKKINKYMCKSFEFYFKNNNFSRKLSTSKVFKSAREDFIVKSPLPPLTYPNVPVDQYVWADIGKWMNKTAVVDGITDKSISYSQLRDKCRIMAIRLRTSLKLKPKDTIAICLPNCVEFPIASLGASEADLIVTTINPIYTPDEISRQLLSSNAKVLFGDASMSEALLKGVKMTKRQIKIIYVTKSSTEAIPVDGIKFHEFIETNGVDLASLPKRECDVNSLAFLPYSSGTTGLNKGAMLSHKNIVSNCVALRAEGLRLAYDAIGDHQDVLPCVLPFFHIYGLTVLLFSKLAQGCKLITLPKFHPDTFLNVMEKYEGNLCFLVPPIIILFNNYEKLRPEHTKSIRFVISGAGPLGSNDVEKFLKIAPNAQYIQGYGLTESSPACFMMLKSSKNYASVGYPINDTEAKIAAVGDSEFRGIGPNKSGEVLVRGPQVMLGYMNDIAATKETITSDGWLRTGDIGYHDENGEFYITDRLKELIKVKAFQVAPAELEEILRSHPEITDAAVIGIPDASTGELPRAFVVKAKNSKLSENEVQDFVAEKVAEYKILDGGVEFIEAIPKNATGKILRKELKKRYV